MCGGTDWGSELPSMYRGLSPRVRGNHSAEGGASGIPRSIPACAGEPSTLARAFNAALVYPRVCGGTSTRIEPTSDSYGLSPRVRGNPLAPFALSPPSGSIPACAGEPATSALYSSVFTVYPRVCGGTPGGLTNPHWGHGLSPRVRGNRLGGGRLPQQEGSIPACAGEPSA